MAVLLDELLERGGVGVRAARDNEAAAPRGTSGSTKMKSPGWKRGSMLSPSMRSTKAPAPTRTGHGMWASASGKPGASVHAPAWAHEISGQPPPVDQGAGSASGPGGGGRSIHPCGLSMARSSFAARRSPTRRALPLLYGRPERIWLM